MRCKLTITQMPVPVPISPAEHAPEGRPRHPDAVLPDACPQLSGAEATIAVPVEHPEDLQQYGRLASTSAASTPSATSPLTLGPGPASPSAPCETAGAAVSAPRCVEFDAELRKTWVLAASSAAVSVPEEPAASHERAKQSTRIREAM
eukprot:CAMPEP_0115490618 /NCGR_PEP_ID=MMETSP0271-20121206/62661_1 /TAXON_ID=71861 /ORGANISM="Scrippsiella trochoidea, Strain CCMP3099" /LENGTH=147 /DNA_ID=CAMNT_0002918899 /DNA_START=283 /DNA_END=724 /DNA_ORIENTATION=+